LEFEHSLEFGGWNLELFLCLAFGVLAQLPIMRPSYLILLILMNFLWAASLSIYKPLGDYLTPGGIVTLRFGLAAVPLAILWPWLPGKGPRGWDLFTTLAMGCVVFMLGHRLQVWGNKLSTAGDTSVLMAMEPLVTSIGAAIFLREHIGPRRWLGFGLGMFGVALLNGLFGPGFRVAGVTASLIFMSSFLCDASYSVLGKGLVQRADPMKTLTLALVIGTAGNLLIDGAQTFKDALAMPAHFWWLIAYMSVFCTAIGYGFWFIVIRESDVNVAAMTIFAQPVAGVILAAVWLHEPLHWGQFWGCLAIVVGLIVGLSRQIKTAGPTVANCQEAASRGA
jgi:drug/metabolite transporter (DMT)-like permease